MSLRMQRHEGTSEEIELDSELCGQVAIDQAEHLVRGKYVLWVVLEVEDRDQV